jgi:hypothetical protein
MNGHGGWRDTSQLRRLTIENLLVNDAGVRDLRLLLAALLSLIICDATPALALNGQDNMHAWSVATAIDKNRLLDQMGGPDFSVSLKESVRSCLAVC